MSKIFVPQEQVQEIIKLYTEENKTRKDIKKILNLPFGDSVIKRILVENGVKIKTNPGAQKGGRKKQEINEELQKQIIDLYVNKKYGLNKIVQVLNLPFSFDKVKSILRDNNIHIRNINEAHEVLKGSQGKRKYFINDDYNFESHNGAWILGFITADGYLPSTKGAYNRVVIELAERDKEVLEKIKQELDYTGPIYIYDQKLGDKIFKKASLTFTSKPIREKLENYGICNAKTFKLKELPKLNDEYMFDFIRGFIDGDGWVGSDFSIGATCASYNFITEMYNYIIHNLNLPYGGSLALDHNNLCFIFYKNDSKILGSKLYDNDYLALDRKKKKFNSLRK